MLLTEVKDESRCVAYVSRRRELSKGNISVSGMCEYGLDSAGSG